MQGREPCRTVEWVALDRTVAVIFGWWHNGGTRHIVGAGDRTLPGGNSIQSSKSHRDAQVEYFAATAPAYDSCQQIVGRDNRNHLRKIAAILDFLRPDRQCRVLEVGTGTGIHAAWVLRHFDVSLTAIDVSLPMLRVAADRLGRAAAPLQLTGGDAANLPFGPDTFDHVFCSETLHHVEMPGAAVAEMARVLRPRGRLALMEPNWLMPVNAVLGLCMPVERGILQMREANLARWAVEAGLTSVEVSNHPVYTPPFPSVLIRVYDRVDRLIGRLPLLRELSIMLLPDGDKACHACGSGIKVSRSRQGVMSSQLDRAAGQSRATQ